MKKNHLFISITTFLIAFLCAGLLSCNSNEDDSSLGSNPNLGKDNFTDNAVTGGVESTGMTYAKVLGYVNHYSLQDIQNISEVGFVGVEYGLSKTSLNERQRFSVTDGRTLNITIKDLLPNTQYYYRTLVEAGSESSGFIRKIGTQVGSFTTKPAAFNGRITTGEATKSYDRINISLGSVDVSGLSSDETYYLGVVYSSNKSKLMSGLNDRYKKAPFDNKWIEKATYDDVTFYRYKSKNDENTLEISELASGVTIYYTTIVIIGDNVFCGDIKSVTTKSSGEFKLPTFTEVNKGFDFIEVGGTNSITNQNNKAINVNDLGDSYAFGVAYSNMKGKLTSGLYDRFKNSGTGYSYWEKKGNYDGVYFLVVPYTNDNTFLLDNLGIGSNVYYCTFLIINEQITTSEVKMLTTRDLSQKTGYVDLGLSCKWAACNYGATSPVDKGTIETMNSSYRDDGYYPTSSQVNELKDCSHEVIKTTGGTIKGVLVKARNGGTGEIYLPHDNYFITSKENRQETGTRTASYLKHFRYSNGTFQISEVCYYWRYAGITGGVNADAHIRLVSYTNSGNDNGTGNITGSSCPDNNHPHAIDMGKGLKWACCNVGAYSPEQIGCYFAWGETFLKANYSFENYQWCNQRSNQLMTKYCTDSSVGTVDGKTQLEMTDDAAQYNWGGSWRMPTYKEYLNLVYDIDYSWSWTNLMGVNGYKVTASNGNSIFLPVSGYYLNNKLLYPEEGNYWTSSLDTDHQRNAHYLKITNSAVISYYYTTRCLGLQVRPVTE